ncbi:hypothetical protein [Bradyrhizobium canariense]|uniref:hypothetical protein n=1 Tax=Bradyrhizobium canariense TaxID=255045 RepID=UPI0011BA5215|nr:hypothetical protein [Bradyrhizobium canariense]
MMPPSWNAEIKNTTENALESAEANHQSETLKDVSLLAVPLANIVDELKEYRDQQEASERRKKPVERLSVAALIATVVFTGLTLIVSNCN